MLFPTFNFDCDSALNTGIINVFGGEALLPKGILVGVAQRELDGEELLDEIFENKDDKVAEPCEERSILIVLFMLLLLVECFSIADVGDGCMIPAGRVVVELVEKLFKGCSGNIDGLNGGRRAGSGLNENGCADICG